MNATDLPIEMLEATSTQLAPTERAALALASSKTEAHLRTLATKHTGITTVADKVAREQAHGAAMELTRARVQVEKVAKEARDDATKYSKAVIAEEKRLIAIVEPEEARLKGLRDAWDDEQERIKREAEEKERARVQAITQRMDEIKAYASLSVQCRTAERVKSLIDKLLAYDLTGFEEFYSDAVDARAAGLKLMEDHHRMMTEREAEAERLKAEREELTRQQAEAQRQAQEQAAQQKAEADRMAAERAEFARQQQEAADKLAAQQADLERQRQEIEAAKAPKVEPAQAAPEEDLFPVLEAAPLHAELPAAPAAPAEIAAPPAAVTAADPNEVPTAWALATVVANEYGITRTLAAQWLNARAADFEALTV